LSPAKGNRSPSSTLAAATRSWAAAVVPKPPSSPSRRWLLGRRGRKQGEAKAVTKQPRLLNRTKSCHVSQGCWYRRYHDPLPLCPVLSNAGERSGSGKSQQFSKALK